MASWPRRLGRLLAGYHGSTPLLCGAVVAFAVTGLLWPRLRLATAYTEPVFGAMAEMGVDKGRDFRALFVFIISAAAFGWVLSVTLRAVSREGPMGQTGKAWNALLWMCLVPAAWRLGTAVLNVEGFSLPWESAVGIEVVFLCAVGLFRRRRELTEALVYQAAGGALLAVVLGGFAGLGLATALGRLWPTTCATFADRGGWFAAGGAGAAGLVAAVLFALPGDTRVLRGRLVRLLFLAQVPLPLLFLILIPPPYLEDGQVRTYAHTPGLPLLLAALILGCWGLLLRRYARWARDGNPDGAHFDAVLGAPGLAAVAVFAVLPTLSFPRLFPYDPFHLGEQMVPYQQWQTFGQVPYVDVVPIHGLMSLARGFLNEAFFDGTAIGFGPAEGLLLAVAVAATFLTVRAQVGTVAALAFSFYCPFIDRLYFLAPGLLLLVYPALLARPARWLLVWAVLGPLMVFYNAGVGPAFVLSSTPLALWMVYRLGRTDSRLLAALLAGLGGTALAVAVLTPLGAMTVGLVRFITDNLSTNFQAYGYAWEMSFAARPSNPAFAGSRFTWELMRFGWLGVVFGAAVVLRGELARPAGERRGPLVWLCLVLIPTFLLSSGWTVCQLQPTEMNRMGSLTALALVCLLPVLVLGGREPARAARAAVFLAVLVGGFNAVELNNWRTFNLMFNSAEGFTQPHADVLFKKPFALNAVPAGAPVVDGAAAGMPRLGRGMLPPAGATDLGYADLLDLKAALDSLLAPGETFIDLSNRTANYYYLERRVPSLYMAPNTTPNRATQSRVLRRLADDRVPVVVAGPMLFTYTPLQAYFLYREWVLRYAAVRRGPWILLVDPARVPDAGPFGCEAQLEVLDQLYSMRNVGRAAASWGRSFAAMADEFREVCRLGDGHLRQETPAGPLPRHTFQLPAPGLRGRDADYLLVELEWDQPDGAAEPTLEVRWQGAAAPEPPSAATAPCDNRRLQATASRPCLLIPLGSNPRWLLADDVRTLELCLSDATGGRPFTVKSLVLLQIKPVD